MMASDRRRSYGEEQQTGHAGAAIMAPEKKGGRARRKGSQGRGDKERHVERTAEGAGQVGGITLVDVDPWGSFFEEFWEQTAESESADRHEIDRKPAKGARPPRGKADRRERSPRAS
jgi:hypothetical protein